MSDNTDGRGSVNDRKLFDESPNFNKSDTVIEKSPKKKKGIAGLKSIVKKKLAFLFFFKNKLEDDGIDVLASSLSYTTILSLIPILAVLLSFFSFHPSFAVYRDEMMGYIIKNMMPQMGAVLTDNINSFIENASKTTTVGVVTLIIIALALIRRIDLTLNKIWHVKVNRPRITTFAVYWMVLTLGPILFGVSIAISSSILASNFLGDGSAAVYLNTIGMKMVPCFLTFVIFSLLFISVPCTKVNVTHAVIGAFFTALVQEFIKQSFTHYVVNFTSYTPVYGAVAALPVLMVWTYINWYVVLLGAELAASMSLYKEEKQTHMVEANLTEKADIN